MVNKLKLSTLTILIIWLLGSCSGNKMGYNNKRWGNIEEFGLSLDMLLSHYMLTYDESPEKAEDILNFIKGMDSVSQQVYFAQYEYFLKNRTKLIFQNEKDDSTRCVAIYFKKIKNKCLLFKTDFKDPCDENYSEHISFFDKNGNYTFGGDDSFRLNESIKKRVSQIVYRYPNQFREDPLKERGQFVRIMLEYKHLKLMDLCTGKEIDISKSSYFADVYNLLDSIAIENNFSRIIIPSFVDKALVYDQ